MLRMSLIVVTGLFVLSFLLRLSTTVTTGSREPSPPTSRESDQVVYVDFLLLFLAVRCLGSRLVLIFGSFT